MEEKNDEMTTGYESLEQDTSAEEARSPKQESQKRFCLIAGLAMTALTALLFVWFVYRAYEMGFTAIFVLPLMASSAITVGFLLRCRRTSCLPTLVAICLVSILCAWAAHELGYRKELADIQAAVRPVIEYIQQFRAERGYPPPTIVEAASGGRKKSGASLQTAVLLGL
jgi:hypothetical protein